MKSSIACLVLSASLLLTAVGLTALALLQFPRTYSTTALARTSPPQSLETAREALERAISAAVVNGSRKHIDAVDAAFQDYLGAVSAREGEILDRMRELETLMGTSRSTSGLGVSYKVKKSANKNPLRAEYEGLSAKLEALRNDFGAANIEVNEVVGARSQGQVSGGVAACNVLIVNGATTTSESGTTADATNTLSGIVTGNGGTVTVSDQVPVSLAGFNVIYDLRFNPALLVGEVSQYLSFLQGGGKLLLVGENGGFTTRNDSVISFVSTAGGGSLSYCDPNCQCGATCSDATLCFTPNTAATFLLPAPGGTTTSGNGTAVLTVAGTCRPVSIFRPAQLTNATAGTLITFFDINTFQSAFGTGNDNLKLICNIAAFFCGSSGGTCNAGGAPCSLTCPPNQFANTGPGATQCCAFVNYPAPTTSGTCGTISCSPASGSCFPVGTTTVTCSEPGGTSCSFTVTVTDNTPPTITCPASINAAAAASCPLATSATANFTVTATDNCPGPVTVVCKNQNNQAVTSGSTLPVGTTTVTCTATDASGNASQCSFTVSAFSFCLQDESSPGNVVLVNAQTGDFSFCCGGVPIASGRGTLTTRGCIGSIDHNKGNRRVHIQWDTAANSGVGAGTAYVQKLSNKVVCQITDKNMSNNTCVCSAAPPPVNPQKPPKETSR